MPSVPGWERGAEGERRESSDPRPPRMPSVQESGGENDVTSPVRLPLNPALDLRRGRKINHWHSGAKEMKKC